MRRDALVDLAPGQAGRVPADQRLQAGVADSPTPARPRPRRPGAPALPRWPSAATASSVARRSARPSSSQVSSSSTRGVPSLARPARPPAWPRRSAGRSSTSAITRSPDDDCHMATPGIARPISSAVRASPSTGARSPCPPHSGHAHPGTCVPAPRALGRSRRSAEPQRPVAGRAQRGRPAPVTRKASRVADPGAWTSTGPRRDCVAQHLRASPGCRVRPRAAPRQTLLDPP